MIIIQYFIIYVPSQQLHGQLQKHNSVYTGNCITNKILIIMIIIQYFIIYVPSQQQCIYRQLHYK
jgi:hypothetical protein